MIIATAGHVDHGKTSLVQALTGVDTDRLAEEKRRGMTIEPGFAHARLGAAPPISFVDVPGHEGYLRQAIAGLNGVDAVLLVVACDDGPMPQTHEHAEVLELLGIERGLVVLTKADRVDAERVQTVAVQARRLLEGKALGAADPLVVSTRTGAGLDALRAALEHLALGAPARAAGRGFRLAVDRVFTRPGAGTVVTGSVLAGRVQAGAALVDGVTGAAWRVRTVQVQGQEVDAAGGGQRCALALAGGARETLARGTWLLAPELFGPTSRWDAQLHCLPVAGRAIEGDREWQLHVGTACLPARVRPLEGRRLEPGTAGLVQVRTAQPVAVLHGDRFVLRDTAAGVLVGGGRVLDAAPPQRLRDRPRRRGELQALQTHDLARALQGLLPVHGVALDRAELQRQWNTSADAVAAACAAAAGIEVPTRSGPRLLAASAWAQRVSAVCTQLQAWHVAQPDSPGLHDAALLRRLQQSHDMRAEKDLNRAAVAAALASAAIERDGFVLRVPGHRARIDDDTQALVQRVHALLRPDGLRPLPWGDLAAQLGMSLGEAQVALARLDALGHVVQVARNRFFLPATVQALMDVAAACAAQAPADGFEAAAFRDRSGIGRNLSIQVLEYFDRIGFTRYRDERRWLAQR